MSSKKYFLVGMPASGKSTIGRLLAGQIGIPFIDLDHEIVKKEGLEITEIFSSKGEDYFRDMERKCLLDITSQHAGFVMATGGGAPCFYNNMSFMNKHGITIFINISVKDLYKKLLLKGTQKRPLLRNLDNLDLFEELKNKFLIRKKFYEQSKICLDQNLGDITSRVNQIIFAIKMLKEESNRQSKI